VVAKLPAVLPRVEDATNSYSPFLPPMRICPYAGAVDVPVHPRNILQIVAALAGTLKARANAAARAKPAAM
jgi:hypothetical protein